MPKKPIRKPIHVRKAPTVRLGRISHSDRVLFRSKAVASLRSSVDTLKERVADGFRARLEDGLRDGEAVPDPTLALELAVRRAETALEALQKADHVYCGQSIDRRTLSEACDHVAREEVQPELVEVRRAIDARYGREAAHRIHRMEGNTRRKPRPAPGSFPNRLVVERQSPRARRGVARTPSVCCRSSRRR